MVRRPPRRPVSPALRALLAAILLVLSWPALVQATRPTARPHHSRPSAPSRVASGTEIALYNGDVTVPDRTVFRPGARFVKTWRIKNAGTVPWTNGYHWHFEAGTLMSGNLVSVPVGATSPGLSTIISVPMQAPMATGVYTSFWQMVDPQGKTFPHQAWVNIVVRSDAQGADATATPTERLSPTANPTAVATVIARPPAQPTLALPGGDGQLVSSAWVGSDVSRSYFPMGSTVGGNDETLGVYYPGPKITHVRVTLYRPDGARRTLLFALASGQHQVLALDRIAPGTGLSAAITADRPVITGRISTGRQGVVLEPNPAQVGRTWLFPSIPANAPPNQLLVLFNPTDTPTTVTLRAGSQGGGCCAAVTTLTVPPLSQYSVPFGTRGNLRGPLSLAAAAPVAVERIAASSDYTSLVGIPGTASAAAHWYLPTVRGTKAGGTINVLNPSATAVMVTIRADLDFGTGRWIERMVAPFSEWRLPLADLSTSDPLSADVSASAPVVASASWNAGPALPVTAMGSPSTAREWSMLVGLGGQGVGDTIDLFNPSSGKSAITLTVEGSRGAVASWQMTLPPHGRASKALPASTVRGGAAVVIRASQPIVAGHGVTSSDGAAAATGSPAGP